MRSLLKRATLKQPAEAGTYVALVAAPTGVTATDCANFAAALAALPAGGQLLLRNTTGGIKYDFTNGVTVNKPCVIEGMGGPDAGVGLATTWSGCATEISSSSATGTAITVSAAGVRLKNFGVSHSGTAPTAGAGICANGNGFIFEDVGVAGFYDGFLVRSGTDWTMRECVAFDNIRYDINLLGDAAMVADFLITSCVLRHANTVPTANLFAKNVQGTKIGDCKFLGNGAPNIIISVPDGALNLDTLIHDNSLEGANGTTAIQIVNTGPSNTGQLARLQIVDNQIAADPGATSGISIVNSTASANNFRYIIIEGNLIEGFATPISLVNCNLVWKGINQEPNVGQQRAIGTAGSASVAVGSWAYSATSTLGRFLQNSGAQNDSIGWKVFLDPGTYTLSWVAIKGSNAAILTVQLDGATVGTYDDYAAAGALAVGSVAGIVVAHGGVHEIKFVAASKNASSSAYYVQLGDSPIVLTKTA